MTPHQIKLVQTSFAKVAPIATTAADLFYGRLFEIAPQVRAMFPDDLSDQKKKLMAMLGTAVTVPTLDGESEIEVAAGTQPGHEEVLRGAGLPRLGGSRRGNQRVILNVIVPTNLSEEQREIAERLDETLEEDNLGPRQGDGLFSRVRRAFG